MSDTPSRAADYPNRLVGRSVPRQEDPRLLTGRGTFIADVSLPRMCHVAFVRSMHAHARITDVDIGAAQREPGVVGVFIGSDFAPVTFEDIFVIEGLRKTPQPPLAVDHVRYVGEPVAMVLADSRALAEDAAELVGVRYEPMTPHIDVEASAGAEDDLLFPELGSNVVFDHSREFGDPEGAFRDAAHVARIRYRSNRYVAAPMECAGLIADFDPASRELAVWASTQSAHLLRSRLAAATGVPQHQIRIRIPDTGGGFGQKIPIRCEEAAVAMAAMRVDRPAKWVEDRYENLVAGPHAKDQIIEAELALDGEGRFLGLRADIVGDGGGYSHNSASALIEPYHASSVMTGAYKIASYGFRARAVLTNKSPVAPYRGVGFTAAQTARELLIDKAARMLGRDPVDLRRQNLVKTSELPYTSCVGMVFDSGAYDEAVDAVVDELDYPGFRERQSRAQGQGRYLGIGISPFVEPTGWGSEGASQTGSWSSFVSHDSASATMDTDGNVTISVGVTSQGQAHETTFAQIAADQLGVPLESVRLIANDTAVMPISTPGTRASRAAVVAGGAVWLAAQELRDKLLTVASVLLEADEEDLTIADGHVHVVGADSHTVSIRDVAVAAHRDLDVRRKVPEPTLSATRFYDPRATYTNGCFGAVVEVDVLTGQVELMQLAASEDCGTVINPMVVAGQARGGIVQGVGAALLEQIVYDPDGQIKTATLMDYLLPTTTSAPQISLTSFQSPSPMTVGGIKGIGESGILGMPAAIAAAVSDALAPFDIDVTETPLLPGRIAELLRERSNEPGET